MTVRMTSKQNYFRTIFREAPGSLVVHGLEVRYKGNELKTLYRYYSSPIMFYI